MLDQKLSTSLLRTTTPYIKKLEEMGILTVADLLWYLPRTYQDRTQVKKIHEVDTREINVIRGTITNIENLITRGRMKITKAEFADDVGNVMEVVWFNQPYVTNVVKAGRDYILAGKVKNEFGRMTFMSPDYEEVKPEQTHMGRIIPVYPEYDTGAGSKNTIGTDWMRTKMQLIIHFAKEFAETLPESILKTEGFISLSSAIQEVHFPSSQENLEKARARISFEELFFLQLEALSKKYAYQKKAGEHARSIPLHADWVKEFLASLPFQLTDSQKVVTYQIFKDMEKPYPMIRLLEGDVGSGKTIVATIVGLHTIQAGYQVAFMVPTEVLARQHFETLQKLLLPPPVGTRHALSLQKDLRIELLIGTLPKKEKDRIHQGLEDGAVDLVIGTHALLQENVGFKNLGFVIIDEQHRFGVDQRKKLAAIGFPHVLHMTATPIPRTLALTIYGDQDLSLLKEMPKGRIPIVTSVIPGKKRQEAYHFIESELIKGRQVYVICPLIEESDKLEFKAVTEEYKRLKEDVFAKFNIGLLHGRLKSEEKEQVMHDFQSGKIQLLVSTTVIEVGIDVKNATIMMIEGADRFGLAQIHQLRGRVGRGEQQSYCFLFSDNTSEEAIHRLKTLEKTNNGFEVAEADLQLRGAGEVYGTRQSGLPDLKMANLFDVQLVEKTRAYAEQILESDPTLEKFPVLKEKLGQSGEWMVS